MSAPGRPKREYRSAQHEGSPVGPLLDPGLPELREGFLDLSRKLPRPIQYVRSFCPPPLGRRYFCKPVFQKNGHGIAT